MAGENSAVVIGTGFGGSVTACRLAQAGFDVTVLERGRDYRQNRLRRGEANVFDLPRESSGRDAWSWCPEKGTLGLYDVKAVSEMEYVQSAGLGGGSLIYANVHLRMPADGFAQGWPEGYSRAALDPYYDLVAYMLDVAPIPADRRPPKTVGFAAAADRLGRSGYFLYPQLAVNFGNPEVETTNRFGQVQEGCRYCGECIVGCRFRAKNTLDLNYLAEAERRGARIRTLCDVRRIDEAAAGGYRVTFSNRAGGEEEVLEAKHVFLCAGAVNSTEFLLRCRDEFRSLNRLGTGLGTRYSGNGDALYFGFGTRDKLEPSNGPTITTALLYDRTEEGIRTWFLVEEGGYPPMFDVYARGIRVLDDVGGPGTLLKADLEQVLAAKAAAWKLLPGNADPNIAVYLCMGRDSAQGRLRLLPETRKLVLEWDLAPNVGLYNRQERLTTDLTRQFGGTPALNPAWRFVRVPGTVHSLGGCPMGTAPDNSVTDSWGQVHGYPGLYVLDGGILPESTGVNPSATIAAVAERNIEGFIRRTRNDPTWQAPDAVAAGQRPRLDPLASAVSLAAGGMPPPLTPALGMTFRESMRGFLHRGQQPSEDYGGGWKAGWLGAERAEIALTVTITDLDVFLNDPNHVASAAGQLVYTPLTGEQGVPVAGGKFHLFSPTDLPGVRSISYLLPFHGTDGQDYLLDGHKVIAGEGLLALWTAMATLFTVIRLGHSESGPAVATGILRFTPVEFLRLLESFEVTGTEDPVEKLQARDRFGHFVAGALWDVFAATGLFGIIGRCWLRFRIWLHNLFGIRDRQ